MLQIVLLPQNEQRDCCPDLLLCGVTGEGGKRWPRPTSVTQNLLKHLESPSAETPKVFASLLLCSSITLTGNLYTGVGTRDRAPLVSLPIPSDSLWPISLGCWGFSDSTLPLVMCVLTPVLMEATGLDGAPISSKNGKQSQPHHQRGLTAECTLHHPWPTTSRPGFLPQCPANPQACVTFHIHQRVIAHLLCAGRTCEYTKILALPELTFQWGWRGGEMDEKLSKACRVLEGHQKMGKES